MVIYDIGIEDKFLGISVHNFSCVFEFTAVETLAVNEFIDLSDELAGPFKYRSFSSYMCGIRLLSTRGGFGNKS